MADLTPIASWTSADVQHFARRAGFGLSPEAAAQLAAQAPGTAIDAWVDGTGLDVTLFANVLATRADPVAEPARTASSTPGAVNVPNEPGPHAYRVDPANAWRNNFSRSQAYLAFRMQYAPYAFGERMALFWHNLFATGWHKVNNAALMLQQNDVLRAHSLDRFDDLLVLVSRDPAMAIWLDSVQNNAAGSHKLVLEVSQTNYTLPGNSAALLTLNSHIGGTTTVGGEGQAVTFQSYAANSKGLFDPEYADVYGVPFSFLPCSGAAQPPKPGPTPTRVRKTAPMPRSPRLRGIWASSARAATGRSGSLARRRWQASGSRSTRSGW